MKKLVLSFFAFVALLLAPPLKIAFLNPGNPGVVHGGHSARAYSVSMNGTVTPLLDNLLGEYNGNRWAVDVTNAVRSDFGSTYPSDLGKQIDGSVALTGISRAEANVFGSMMKPAADRSTMQEDAWAMLDNDPLKHMVQPRDLGLENYLEAGSENYSTFDASRYNAAPGMKRLVSGSNQEFTVASTPEPATFALLGSGLLLVGSARCVRRRKAAGPRRDAHTLGTPSDSRESDTLKGLSCRPRPFRGEN